jgi:two-component system, cell cycle sensor histidine kinase and response regulator CckA
VSLSPEDAADLIIRGGRVSDANDAAAALLGRNRGYELLGHRLPGLLVRETDALRQVLIDFLAHGYCLSDRPLQLGSDSDARALVHSLTGVVERGSLVRIWGVQRPASSPQAVPQQFYELQKSASIVLLSCRVAHDFNNLLTAILGYGKMVHDSLEPGSVCQRDMEQVLTAARRGETLTRQLLTFSRRQRSRTDLFDLNAALAEFEPLLRRVIPEKIEIVLSTTSSPTLVHGDRGQLELVVMNIALNARDAMPQGGTLTMQTAVDVMDDDTPGRVRLTMSDTGTGISEDMRDRIFDPFFTTKPGAIGLGLATAREIVVTQCGGRIDVESEPGRGATFLIVLNPPPPESRSVGQPATIAHIDGYRSRQDG